MTRDKFVLQNLMDWKETGSNVTAQHDDDDEQLQNASTERRKSMKFGTQPNVSIMMSLVGRARLNSWSLVRFPVPLVPIGSSASSGLNSVRLHRQRPVDLKHTQFHLKVPAVL